MRPSIWLSSLFILFTTSFGAAAATKNADDCLDEAMVNEIRSQVMVAPTDFAAYDHCDPHSHTYKIYQALIVMKTMQNNEAALGEPFNQHILNGNFWKYFTERASQVLEETECKPNVLAYVMGSLKDGVVHVCPLLLDDTQLSYERAAVMLHEVRHFDGFDHVTCSRGMRQGDLNSCDTSIEEKGSYAVTVEVMSKMGLTMKEVPRVQRALLNALAVSYANDVFNEPVRPYDLTAFYVESRDRHAYLYSHTGLVEVAPLPPGQIISRTGSLILFPADRGDAFTPNTFSSQMEPLPATGLTATTYNSTPHDQRDPVVNILNLGYLSASVTENQVAGQLETDSDDTIVKVPGPITAAFSGDELGRPDRDSVYVLNTKQELYRVQFTGTQLYTIEKVENSLGEFTQFTIFDNERLGLNTAGQVMVQGKAGAWSPFQPLSALSLSRMTRPFTWDQYFEDSADAVARF